MSDPKTLFLLDAYALIYRSYYAFINNPRITTTGINTSATFGFCNFLIELLELEKPTHIAVIFDPEGPTFRHEMGSTRPSICQSSLVSPRKPHNVPRCRKI